MKNIIKTSASAFMAGIFISIGGAVFLSCENKVIGAVLFSVGLFTICTFGFHLFTGKVCYAFQNDISYASLLPAIWVFNWIGTAAFATLLSFTRNGAALQEKAMNLIAPKIADSYPSLFLLGIACNILIFLAVEGYKKNPHELGKYLSIVFGVSVFILSGTEHCVADMFYFAMAGEWSFQMLLRVVTITLGNAVGGILAAEATRFIQTKK